MVRNVEKGDDAARRAVVLQKNELRLRAVGRGKHVTKEMEATLMLDKSLLDYGITIANWLGESAFSVFFKHECFDVRRSDAP